MNVKPEELEVLIEDVIFNGLTPMIHGSPGTGKSSIVKQIAEKHKLYLVDIRLSQIEATDLLGFPFVENGRSDFHPPKYLPLTEDKVPEGYNGWLVFLDEFNSCDIEVQKASYKLILDRMVGSRNLHDKTYLVCAGNLDSDNAITNPIYSPMQSRLIHFTLSSDLETWLEHFEDVLDSRIVGFLSFRKDQFYSLNTNGSELTYPCNRTWMFLNSLIKDKPNLKTIHHHLIRGTIGESTGNQFIHFVNNKAALPSLNILLNDPTYVIPNDVDIQYAILSLLLESLKPKYIEKIIEFVARMDKTYQVIVFKKLIKKNQELRTNPILDKFLSDNQWLFH